MLLEQKRIILNKELENYKVQYAKLKEDWKKLFDEAFNSLKIANVEIRDG